MKDYTKRDAFEAKTHQLFDEYNSDNTKWTPRSAVIGLVFRSLHSSALSLERIERIGAAMAGFDNISLQEDLTKLVRAKVLRSYSKRGKRLYEVNY